MNIVYECVAVCCRVLQYGAVCRSVVRCVASACICGHVAAHMCVCGSTCVCLHALRGVCLCEGGGYHAVWDPVYFSTTIVCLTFTTRVREGGDTYIHIYIYI